MTRRRILPLALAALLAGRLLSLGAYPLMDSTEARYAEIARKMFELGDWVTPWFDYGVPFWGKPPLSFWITAAGFKLFGVNEFGARILHLACALAIAGLLWEWIARRSRRQALYAVALLGGSALFLTAAGAVITDTSLALGTTLAMRGFWLGLHGAEEERRRERWLLFAGLALGLLAKGPVALVLSGLPIVLWTAWERKLPAAWKALPWLRGGLAAVALAAPWYLLAEWRTPGFLEYFLAGEHWQRFLVPGWKGDLYGSAHDFPRGAIWLFAALALLPWSLLLPLAALRWQGGASADAPERSWRHYCLLWGLAPCLFFTAAGNILWTYVLPGLPGLALAAAAWLDSGDARQAGVEKLLAAGLAASFVVTAAAAIAFHLSGEAGQRSAKALLAEYEARRSASEPLVFLHRRPFSGAFYSGGKAELASDERQLARRLENGPAFVAIPREAVPGLPAWLARSLAPAIDKGAFRLYRSTSRRPKRPGAAYAAHLACPQYTRSCVRP